MHFYLKKNKYTTATINRDIMMRFTYMKKKRERKIMKQEKVRVKKKVNENLPIKFT